jgi:hypothetical protein
VCAIGRNCPSFITSHFIRFFLSPLFFSFFTLPKVNYIAQNIPTDKFLKFT